MAMGCRIGDSGPGRNGHRPGEPMPFWPGSTPSALGLVLTPAANGGHPIPGGGIRDLLITRWTTSTFPGIRRASGDGDDV